jgi:hypothetical protein
MVATVLIREKNGAGETATDKTSGTIRFKNADNATVDANNPMVIPGSGSDFSYEKYLRLNVSVAPDTQIENLQAYSDGSNGFGTGVSGWYKTVGSYTTPTEPANATGFTDLFSATSGSPIDMDATNTGPFSEIGDIGDYLVLMLEVASTAAQGALTAETVTFSYDES